MSKYFLGELNSELLAVLLANVRVREDWAREQGFFSSASGRPCYIHRPEASDINIHDIALALSRYARWGGRTTVHQRAYSVAQHSVMVSRLANPEHAMEGLLHDASEAYLGDVISPLKRELRSVYGPIERIWNMEIGRRFGLEDRLANMPVDVQCADLIALEVERWDIMKQVGEPIWGADVRPTYFPTIVPVDEYEAYVMFMDRFAELGGKL